MILLCWVHMMLIVHHVLLIDRCVHDLMLLEIGIHNHLTHLIHLPIRMANDLRVVGGTVIHQHVLILSIRPHYQLVLLETSLWGLVWLVWILLIV